MLNKYCLVVLFNLYHDTQNHLGVDRTINTFYLRFYCVSMATQVNNMVKICITCQARKVMYHRPLCNAPMEIIAVDYLVVTNQVAILQSLTIVDELTTFVFIILVCNMKA